MLVRSSIDELEVVKVSYLVTKYILVSLICMIYLYCIGKTLFKASPQPQP